MNQLATAVPLAIVVAMGALGQALATEFTYMEWRWIEEELANDGFEPGPVDGRPGPKIRWPNGDRYQRQWRNDERHGEGIFIWASGKQVHGTTRSGLLHGPVAWTSPTGEQSIEEYNDGRRVAPSSRAPDNQFLPTPRDPARSDALTGGSSGGQEP